MSKSLAIPEEVVTSKIYLIRNHKVMLDIDLAELYQVETKRLNEQVKRNADRFPEDFMFQLTESEWENLRSQIATSKNGRRGKKVYAVSFYGAWRVDVVQCVEQRKSYPGEYSNHEDIHEV
jgi:hypothetical protein